MKPKEAFEQIETTLEVMKTRDVADIHKLATTLFRPVDALAIVDLQLSTEIKTKITEILSFAELAPILSKIEEIKQILEQLKVKQAARPKRTYLGVMNVQRSAGYLKAIQRYASYTKSIEKLENDIINSEVYQENLHERMKYGGYKDYLHARLTGNLRVMYLVDSKTKTIRFEDIITKNELEKA